MPHNHSHGGHDSHVHGGHKHHGHGHGHHHHPADFGRAFAVGIALNLGFVAVEARLRLLGQFDGPARRRRPQSLRRARPCRRLGRRRSWPSGRRRADSPTACRAASILAALANAVLLLIAVAFIAYHAVIRLIIPDLVEGGTVTIVAGDRHRHQRRHRPDVRARPQGATSTSAAPICTWSPTRWSRPEWSSPGSLILLDRLAVGRSGGQPDRRRC